MSKTKISEFSTTPGNNTDINGINISEGCAPSGINNAIRELMSDLKEWQSGAMDVYVIPQGTAAAPGIQLYGDLDTGLYGYAANQLGVAVGGASAGYFSSAGWNGNITGDINATTIDTTNLEVTNIKAKDGTAAIALTDSTGVVTLARTTSATNSVNEMLVLEHYSTGTISAGFGSGIKFFGENTSGGNSVYAAIHAVWEGGIGDPSGGALVFLTDGYVGDNTERVRITSEGKVGIGTATPSTTLEVAGSATVTGATTLSATTQNIALGTSQTTGTWTAGGASQTGALTLDQSTKTHTLNLGTGATESGLTKTVNIGTGGVSTSTTTITIGSANGTSTTLNGTVTAATLNSTTIDTTNIEVTNIKAKDGSASATIADSTGVMTIASSVLTTTDINGGTIDGTTIGGSTAAAGTFTTATATTGNITTVNATTVDTTDIEVTNIKAKDGTAALSIADSTGAVTVATAFAANGGAVFNENGADVDFRVEGDTNANLIFADASTDRVGIGTNAPTNLLSVAGNVNITGNTTLGDASTDTVLVNGYMAVGGALNSGVAVRIGSSALGGATQRGAYADVTFTSASTTRGAAFESNPSTAVASFTVTDVMGFSAQNVATLGAGSTITNQHGVYVNDQTRGTNNFGITSLVSSGTNKWNIYASGSAANYFAGNVLVGTTASLGTAGVQVAAVATDPFEGYRFGANANGPTVSLYKNRGATVGTNAVVVSGDELGTIAFRGYDGAAYRAGAFITGNVDGTPGASDMPGRLTFSTTADGAATPTERMRIDSSGNVGIGTNAPNTNVEISTTVDPILRLNNSTNTVTTGADIGEIQFYTNDASVNGTGVKAFVKTVAQAFGSAQGGADLVFGTAAYAVGDASEKMRIDKDGNVGIGTSSPAYKLDVFSGTNNSAIARFTGAQSAKGLIVSTYASNGNDGGVNLASTDSISLSTASTERMRIDASGNLGVGTTAPQATIVAAGSNATIYKAMILRNSNGSDGSSATIDFETSSGTQGAEAAMAGRIAGLRTGSGTSGALTFSTTNGGTLGERARITSGGQLFVTSSLAGDNLFRVKNTSATGYGVSIEVNNSSSGTYRFFEGVDSGPTQKIAIYTNGDVKNTNGVFAAFSDAKLKKDIVDAGSQWDDIKSLRVRKYRLKNDPEGVLQIGLVAQEVETVSPGLVNESQDETRDEDGKIVLTGEVTKGVKYSILYMKAVKALQEAMARIEKLEAEVAALKGV